MTRKITGTIFGPGSDRVPVVVFCVSCQNHTMETSVMNVIIRDRIFQIEEI